MKKFFCFIAAVVTVLSFYIKGFALDFVNPNIGFEPKCRSVLLVNLDTDANIYEKNATERLPMASLTKIMTAILTIENIEKLSEKENTKIKIRDEILKSLYGTGSSLSNIKAGEEYTILQLLHCLLVTSGNDAALVLADFIGRGSITNFVDMMNKRAKALNCNDTNFVNPHGLDSENHYTTATDLAKILKYCLKNETFRKIAGKASCAIPTTNKILQIELPIPFPITISGFPRIADFIVIIISGKLVPIPTISIPIIISDIFNFFASPVAPFTIKFAPFTNKTKPIINKKII